MRILLTGTQGQVGGALLPLLRTRGTVVAPNETEFDLTGLEGVTASNRMPTGRSRLSQQWPYGRELADQPSVALVAIAVDE